MENQEMPQVRRPAGVTMQQLNIVRLTRSYRASRIWMILLGFMFSLVSMGGVFLFIPFTLAEKTSGPFVYLLALLSGGILALPAIQSFRYSAAIKKFLAEPSLDEHRKLIIQYHRIWRILGILCLLGTLLFAFGAVFMFIGLIFSLDT